MRKIGVNAYHPPSNDITRRICPRPPGRALDAEPTDAFEGSVQHVDVNVLSNLATRVTKFAGRQRCRCNSDLRSGTDRK